MFFKSKIILVGVFIFLYVLFNTITIDAQYRIVGGIDVEDDEYIPYQISLQILRNNGRYRHFCGGSIISPRHILTAAHCVKGHDSSELSVVAGIRDINATGQRSQVLSYDIHPNYQELVTADIAVLFIDPPLVLDGEKVNKINLNKENIGGGVLLMLTGWGSVNADMAIYPIRMQKLIYKSITNEECKPKMSNLTSAEICAKKSDTGSCIGDSGSPLVTRKGTRFLQVGIVSYGSTTCANNNPDVYTRTAYFADWIKKCLE